MIKMKPGISDLEKHVKAYKVLNGPGMYQATLRTFYRSIFIVNLHNRYI
jgi:hypothetical protein